MRGRRLHRTLGLVMLLPFIAWSTSAAFFLLRPRFEQAYEMLGPQLYPVSGHYALPADADWLEARLLQTALGRHLLLRDAQGWRHLNADTLLDMPFPDKEALRTLLHDAFRTNPERYGRVTQVEGNQLQTDTGVQIELDWNSLSFTQSGEDTRWIDRIYNIHYLRWTGLDWLDEILGLAGLGMLMIMTWTGGKMVLAPVRRGQTSTAQLSLKQ